MLTLRCRPFTSSLRRFSATTTKTTDIVNETTSDNSKQNAKVIKTKGMRNKGLPDIKGVTYTPIEAITLARKYSKARFDETVQLAVQLRLDVRKQDQMIRTALSLPHGSGKKVVVAVFAEGEDAHLATEAGADIVGTTSLIESVTAGKIEFSRCITTPSMVGKLKPVARILGPKGLMPNAKVGTVTDDIIGAVEAAKKGVIDIRTDKYGILHAPIGKLSFSDEQLKENLKAFMIGVRENRPSGSKGKYMKAAHLSTSMGPGISLELNHIDSSNAMFMQDKKME